MLGLFGQNISQIPPAKTMGRLHNNDAMLHPQSSILRHYVIKC